jgi:F-type H+-transporting ATPase subunit gamma
MPSLRDIRQRIGSVKNTRQITKAMKLVAGAKLRRATEAALAARPYQETLQRVLDRVVSAAPDLEHPMLTQPDNQKDILVVLYTSDRGLCGSFNGQLCRRTQEHIDRLVADGKTVRIRCYGKKGRGYFAARGYTIEDAKVDLLPADYPRLADELATSLVTALNNDEFSQCVLAFNKYRSVMSQVPAFEVVLPMKVGGGDAAEPEVDVKATTALQAKAGGPENVRELAESLGMASTADYLYEPAAAEILGNLLPAALRTRLFQGLLETQAGEQAARMTAMDSATRNASQLIDGLTLQYNRARQAAITKELIEIVSGAEAL